MSLTSLEQNSIGKKNVRVLIIAATTRDNSKAFDSFTETCSEVDIVDAIEDGIQSIRRKNISFQPYHLLLIEEGIVKSNGDNAINSLRRAAGVHPPRILLTISDSDLQFLPSGVDGILREPVDVEDAIALLEPPAPVKSAPVRTRTRQLSILVVEDDPLSLELMKIVLSKNGYAVTLAASGLEAINQCKKTQFDLVFMDLQMPGMDGFTAAETIRSNEESGKRTPIVALTASNITPAASETFSREFARILTKPFEIRLLLQAIDDFTQTHPVEDLEPASLDLAQAVRHFSMDYSQLKPIFKEFCASLPERLASLEQAAENCGANELALRAHNLKGTSANIGAMKLSTLAARLEDEENIPNADEVRSILEQLRVEAGNLQKQADEILIVDDPQSQDVPREK